MEEDEILRLLREAVEDSEWISRNYDELKKKYEGKIFAVRRKKVVAAAETVEELRKMLEARGENISFLLIESIPPKGVSFIL
jgi:predicted translin family RNA/ssDNA-binding protein